ncbi:hypothetical protein H8B09_13830 [Paenibacillus sp. PR3]|uniref:Mor transcription activator domain-containing protein n=1 Tax=Paenibacillus terricola TaxID=2763503 RepID=A0ABR8MXT0_9BACL|nr:CD3324 family protein [Paenibacillus terricola]MBD3919837.1 hypothetical protein [Paenibacillus terricola]
MKYINAASILPNHVLKEIQKYVHGGVIYIPAPEDSRKKWGQQSGGRHFLSTRNDEIRQRFSAGISMQELSDIYCLSYHSIKKIIYSKR